MTDLASRATEYRSALPFPHTVIDDFTSPEVLQEVLKEWPSTDNFTYKQCDTSIKYHLSDFSKFGPQTQKLFKDLNSKFFVSQLEKLTGITDLISDPTLEGGGLHMIPRGGFLKTHVDFNYLKSFGTMRRINLLLYLNEGWDESWGGDLELLDLPTKTHTTIRPWYNRCVIFNTTEDSYHGHPHPMSNPEGTFRKSIALYYYRAEPPPEYQHSTIYIEPDLKGFTTELID